MKRKELWELLGEVPADMIEEASVSRKGNRVLWLRRALPLAAAVLLLCATAVAAGKYFGWQDVLNAGPEQMTDYTEPLAVQVDAGDITFTVTEALADERVLYLLWEMQAPAAIFGERSTVDGRLDFGEASVDAGGGVIFSAQPPQGKEQNPVRLSGGGLERRHAGQHCSPAGKRAGTSGTDGRYLYCEGGYESAV